MASDLSNSDSYQDRQKWDLGAWPEMYDRLKELRMTVFTAEPGIELNLMVFTIASQAAGCRHCTAHGAYGLTNFGVPIAKVQALWEFADSPMFSPRERAALSFAAAAGGTPRHVTPEHHAELRSHFSDAEVRTLLSAASIAGFMNTYNDSLATVTDQASVDWASQYLAPLGWDVGKHVGQSHEQRLQGPPGT